MSPDYVLVPRDKQDALVAAFQKAYDAFWPHPKGNLDEKSEIGHIITPESQARILKLISGTKGTIVKGGESSGRRIAMTIVRDVKVDDVLMAGYVFSLPPSRSLLWAHVVLIQGNFWPYSSNRPRR